MFDKYNILKDLLIIKYFKPKLLSKLIFLVTN